MSKNSKFEDSLDFVAKYFQPDKFSKRRKQTDFYSITGKRNAFNIFSSVPRKVAAASITVALVASASCLIYLKSSHNPVSLNQIHFVRNQLKPMSLRLNMWITR